MTEFWSKEEAKKNVVDAINICGDVTLFCHRLKCSRQACYMWMHGQRSPQDIFRRKILRILTRHKNKMNDPKFADYQKARQ